MVTIIKGSREQSFKEGMNMEHEKHEHKHERHEEHEHQGLHFHHNIVHEEGRINYHEAKAETKKVTHFHKMEED